jgi:type II secretory pathway pseudopilin PulG
MIPLLIFWLLKNFRKVKTAAQKSAMTKSLHLMLTLMLLSSSIHAQERVYRYNVFHSGEIKGELVVSQKVSAKQVHVKIVSEVRTRFLIKVIVKSIEEAIFEDGVLVYSSLYRLVNGDEKTNQQIQATGVGYKLTSKNKTTTVPSYPIHHSILLLYYQEPVNISKVYSDNFQQYVDVKKVGANKYLVTLPNGNTTYYCYKNGICTSVEVKQFYNLEFLLIP